MDDEVDKEKELWIAPIVKGLLDVVKKRVLTKDMDFVLVIDGEEGSGKSVLAQQIAKYLDNDFNIDKIAFNSEEFLRLIKSPKIKKGSCIILDEAFSAANSRASLTDVNRAMIGVATEMRQKNLFVLFCIPSFFDLDRYFALWRCRSLFHIYFTPEENRRYIIFPKDYKKDLYLLGKKTYNYNRPHSPYPPFSFPKYYSVDEIEYRKRKAEAFRKRTISNQARVWLTQRNALAKHIIKTFNLTQDEAAKIPALYGAPPLSQQTLSLIMKEIEKEEN
jgi:ABC-type dipeptide/oligopeptide/nickel transport system ATPase component